MVWLSVNEFKNLTGIKIDDLTIEQALQIAFKTIVKRSFISQRYETQSNSTKHILSHPIADINGDSIIGTSDIDIWEEDSNFNEYDLEDNVVNVTNNRRRSIVELDDSYPTSSRKLYIDYKTCRAKIDDMIDELKELLKLLTVDYLFTTVPYSKLQRGISNWVINGVSVSFDLAIMNTVKEQNLIREKELFNQLRKVRVDGISPGRSYHQALDTFRHGINFRR